MASFKTGSIVLSKHSCSSLRSSSVSSFFYSTRVFLFFSASFSAAVNSSSISLITISASHGVAGMLIHNHTRRTVRYFISTYHYLSPLCRDTLPGALSHKGCVRHTSSDMSRTFSRAFMFSINLFIFSCGRVFIAAFSNLAAISE